MPIDLSLYLSPVRFAQRWQKSKRNVHWLKILCFCVGNVICQASHRGPARRPMRRTIACYFCCVNSSHQSGGHCFDVSFNPRDLPCKKNARIIAHLQSLVEHRRSADESVAVNLSKADEFGLFEPGNQTKHALLLTELQMVLKSNEVV